MTRLRKILTLLLLAVYITATGSRMWASIDCEMHHGAMTAPLQHGSAAATNHSTASMTVKSCCDAHHSQDLSLYTAGSHFTMPAKPLAASWAAATVPVATRLPGPQACTLGRPARPGPPSLPLPPRGGSGLRAPPATV